MQRRSGILQRMVKLFWVLSTSLSPQSIHYVTRQLKIHCSPFVSMRQPGMQLFSKYFSMLLWKKFLLTSIVWIKKYVQHFGWWNGTDILRIKYFTRCREFIYLWISQSVYWLVCRLSDWEIRAKFLFRGRDFLIPIASRPTLGPTQRHMQWIPELFPLE